MQRKLRLQEDVASTSGAQHVTAGKRTGTRVEVEPRIPDAACTVIVTRLERAAPVQAVSIGVEHSTSRFDPPLLASLDLSQNNDLFALSSGSIAES